MQPDCIRKSWERFLSKETGAFNHAVALFCWCASPCFTVQIAVSEELVIWWGALTKHILEETGDHTITSLLT